MGATLAEPSTSHNLGAIDAPRAGAVTDNWFLHLLRFLLVSALYGLSTFFVIPVLVLLPLMLRDTGRRGRDFFLVLIPILGTALIIQTVWRYTARFVYWPTREDLQSRTLFSDSRRAVDVALPVHEQLSLGAPEASGNAARSASLGSWVVAGFVVAALIVSNVAAWIVLLDERGERADLQWQVERQVADLHVSSAVLVCPVGAEPCPLTHVVSGLAPASQIGLAITNLAGQDIRSIPGASYFYTEVLSADDAGTATFGFEFTAEHATSFNFTYTDLSGGGGSSSATVTWR